MILIETKGSSFFLLIIICIFIEMVRHARLLGVGHGDEPSTVSYNLPIRNNPVEVDQCIRYQTTRITRYSYFNGAN